MLFYPIVKFTNSLLLRKYKISKYFRRCKPVTLKMSLPKLQLSNTTVNSAKTFSRKNSVCNFIDESSCELKATSALSQASVSILFKSQEEISGYSLGKAAVKESLEQVFVSL